MEEIITLINFINELVNDEFYEYIEVDARYYFLNGGCLEFAKVLKTFIPNSRIAINHNNHVVIMYNNKFYDCTGEIKNDGFNLLDEKELSYIENIVGRPEINFEYKQVNEAIINEFLQCGDYPKTMVKQINENLTNSESYV